MSARSAVPAATACPWRSSGPRPRRSGHRAGPRMGGPRPSGGWTGWPPLARPPRTTAVPEARHGAMPHLTVLFDTTSGADHPGAGQGPDGADHRAEPGVARPGSGRTSHGAVLTARQILTLICRAEISVIRWRDGLPLDVGRRYRTETPAIRRALAARDRGYRWPGCGLPATWCTAHHLRPWKRGGKTRVTNLVLLCFVHHHYFIHLLGWTLSG